MGDSILSVTDELRDAAFPDRSRMAPLRLAKPTALAAGLERVSPELRPLQEWLVTALGSKKKLEAPLGDDPIAKLRAILAVRLDPPQVVSSTLAAAHGLLPVLEVATSPSPIVAVSQIGTPTRVWLEAKTGDGRLSADGRAVVLVPQLVPWIEGLRSCLDGASPDVRARAVALAESARPGASLTIRAALARALRHEDWAEEDAQSLLRGGHSGSAHESATIVRLLLPYVRTEESFTGLLPFTGSGLFGTSTYAEVLVRAPPERALKRILALLAKPLEQEQTSHVIQIATALACFDDAEAAKAIAAAAPLAPDVARRYFADHPALRPHLDAAAQGRGKPAAAVRALAIEIDRQAVAAHAPSGSVALPRCLAKPPWLERSEPWPARNLDVIVDREAVIATQGMKGTQSTKTPAHDDDDARVLAEKGALDPARFAALSDEAALAHLDRLPAWGLGWAVARFGARAIPGLAALMTKKPMKSHRDVIATLRSPRLAAVAWGWHDDEAWLLADPEISALGLVPELFAVQLERRFRAELGLLRLVVAGHRASVEAAAARYGADVAEATSAILERDPWTRLPDPLPKLHPKLEDGSLPVLVTRDGPLPPSTIPTIGKLLAVSPLWLPHPGLVELRAECTLESREAFAWEVYEKTWSMDAIAHLGGDACVRKLDALMSTKRGEMKPEERFRAYAVLARVGTPLALVLLQKHALASPWADRNVAIDALLDELSRTRGVTRATLEDDAFAGLEVAKSELVLDYGPRSFRVKLDDHLEPQLFGGDGGRVPKLPKPTKKDDAEKAARAKEALEALALDLDDVRETVLGHFERAMATGRAWDEVRFHRAVVSHPLLGQLARRLVFAATAAAGRRMFRVAEDGTYADANDAAFVVAESATITVAHPIEMSDEDRAKLRQLFHDYAIIQPFPQIERTTFRLEAAERTATELGRFAYRRVAAARLEGLLGWPGWQHGDHTRMVKPLGLRSAQLDIARRGVHARGQTAADELGLVRVVERGEARPLAVLTPIEASELLRDLESLPTA